jgi:hypothetical protein
MLELEHQTYGLTGLTKVWAVSGMSRGVIVAHPSAGGFALELESEIYVCGVRSRRIDR